MDRPAAQERRRYARVPIRVPATLSPAFEGPVELWQISQEGMFLKMERSPKQLDSIKVQAQLREGLLNATVQIRSFLPKGSFSGYPDVSGCGCLVTQMSQDSRRVVQAYLSRMRDLYSQMQFQMAIGKMPAQQQLKDACLELVTDRAQLKEHIQRMVRSFTQRRL